MTGAHTHLLVNHVSLFAAFFGMFAMVWGIARKVKEMKIAASLLFILAAGFSVLALETGESAEDIVEDLPGVSESIIHQHEEAAEAANVACIILGVVAVAGLVTARFKPQYSKYVETASVVVALSAAALLGRAANLGGQVRHTEIRDAKTAVENHQKNDSAPTTEHHEEKENH